MVKEASETSSFSLPPSRELIFPGEMNTLAEQQLGAGKLVVNEQAILENQHPREAERLHQQEIAQKVDQLESRTEVKPPYQDFSPSSINTPSYISARTIEALAVALSGGQGKDALPPVQAEALKPPQQKQEINLKQTFPAGSREEKHWREVTDDVIGPQEKPLGGGLLVGSVDAQGPVPDENGEWEAEIQPGVFQKHIIERDFRWGDGRTCVLEGDSTRDYRQQGMQVSIHNPSAMGIEGWEQVDQWTRATVNSTLTGQFSCTFLDGRREEWMWRKVAIIFTDRTGQSFWAAVNPESIGPAE